MDVQWINSDNGDNKLMIMTMAAEVEVAKRRCYNATEASFFL